MYQGFAHKYDNVRRELKLLLANTSAIDEAILKHGGKKPKMDVIQELTEKVEKLTSLVELATVNTQTKIRASQLSKERQNGW